MRARVLAAGLLVLLALAAYFGRSLQGRAQGRFPSSYAPEPEGLLAFRRLLDEMALPNAVLTRPWDELLEPPDEPLSLLIVATPLRRPPQPGEIEALRGWLEAGGSLLVFDDATRLERSARFADLLAELDLEATSPESEFDPRQLALRRPRTRRASGTPARPSHSRLERLVLNDGASLVDGSAAVPLAVDGHGGVLAGLVRVGQGRAVRIMGSPAANDRLLEGDNLELVLRLVASLRRDGVAGFDEYHQGFGTAGPARRLPLAVLVSGEAQALFALVLFAVARGVRFGPPRADPRHPRRSSLEFARSMAALYRRAGACQHAVAEARLRFLREARLRWSLPEDVGLDRLAAVAAPRAGLPYEAVRETMRRAEEAAGAKRLGEREMVERVRELSRLEEESFHGRTAGS